MANGGVFSLDTDYDGIGAKDYESFGLQREFKVAF